MGMVEDFTRNRWLSWNPWNMEF